MTVVYTARHTRRLRGWWTRMVNSLSLDFLLTVSGLALVADLYQSWQKTGHTSPIGLLAFSMWSVTIILAFYLCEAPYSRLVRLQTWIQRFGIKNCAWLLALSIFLIDQLSMPVLAQTGEGEGEGEGEGSWGFFFTNIYSKINTILSASDNSAAALPVINFAFGILQILLISYIVWSVAKAIQVGREDENWMQALRTPALVVLAVVGGDFAVSLI